MNNLKTYEGYNYTYSRDLKQKSEYLDFVVLYDQAEREFDLIPSGGGINQGPWRTMETIRTILKKKGVSQNVIDLIKAGSPLKYMIEELREPLNDIGFNIIIRDLDELKKMTAPIYLISTPSGELINVSISSIPEFIDKKLISYDKKLGKYVCKDKDYEILKNYVVHYSYVPKGVNKPKEKPKKEEPQKIVMDQDTKENYLQYLLKELNKGNISRKTYFKMLKDVNLK